ncbi:hypothetical protein [Amycolatopsis sp. H20-H5]|uniref:hypothetical protein n=1 Tax=Amycolatopsis sp. H20-H5 TaxID=3046309 RepID=UPI002DBF0C54|nr:hypothetical protein [Amycolatopsis sp. H20-H5]MEC3981478.1 hypothetical protein [Amycolatopsis sp. H20-H5]
MNTAAKVSALGLGLVLAFGTAWAAGAAVGPLGPASAEAAPVETPELGGLTDTAGGCRLELAGQRLVPGVPGGLSFRILGRGDVSVTVFDVDHDQAMHLIFVRRDGSGYEHLHPTLAADGTWTTQVGPAAAGTYRVIADVTPRGGLKVAWGADVQVAGQDEPAPGGPSRTFAVDGYRVDLAGDLRPGAASEVTAMVTKDGAPVSDLQPYLGAYGHLVALRAADLGFLHVHPADGGVTAGPAVRFAADVPVSGRYRLFLDFRHGGRVHIAEFALDTITLSGGKPGEHGHLTEGKP